MTSDPFIFSDRLSLRNRILPYRRVTKESLQDFNDALASGDTKAAIKILGSVFYQNNNTSPKKFLAALNENDIVTAMIILSGDIYHSNLNKNLQQLDVNETFRRHFGMIPKRKN